MFILVLASNQIIKEIQNLKTFLQLMFIEFCTQKWGKATLLALATLLATANKDWLLQLANNNRSTFLFLFFVIYWLRFYLSELIPKSSAQQTTLHHADLKRLKEEARITVTNYDDNRFFGGGFKIHWIFEHRLRAIPTVTVQSYKLSEEFKRYSSQLELRHEPHEGSKAKLEFSLHFHIAGFGSYQMLALEDVFDSIELTVDARPFSQSSFYGKVLHFFSVTARQHKYFKMLC